MTGPLAVAENSRAVKLLVEKDLVKLFHKLSDDVFAKSSILIKNTVRGQK